MFPQLYINMKQSFINLSENEKKFLISVLNDGSKIDADIAREIRISKSSAHRIRRKLEKSGLISEYIAIVDLDKLGVDVFFVILFEWNGFDDEELTKKSFKELENDPHIVFFANGEGSVGMTNVLFMGFKNVDEFNKYFKGFRKKYGKFINNIINFMIPAKQLIKNDFTELAKFAIKNL